MTPEEYNLTQANDALRARVAELEVRNDEIIKDRNVLGDIIEALKNACAAKDEGLKPLADIPLQSDTYPDTQGDKAYVWSPTSAVPYVKAARAALALPKPLDDGDKRGDDRDKAGEPGNNPLR